MNNQPYTVAYLLADALQGQMEVKQEECLGIAGQAVSTQEMRDALREAQVWDQACKMVIQELGDLVTGANNES